MEYSEKISLIDKEISKLEIELDACFEYGFIFSASQIEDRIEQLDRMKQRLGIMVASK